MRRSGYADGVRLVAAVSISLLTAATVLAACSTFGSTDAPAPDAGAESGGSADAMETGATPPPPPSDGGADGSDAAHPGDLFDDGFEGEVVGNACAKWSCSGCRSKVVTDFAHGGLASCLVCLTNNSGISFTVGAPAPGDGDYVVEAYLSAASSDAGPPTMGLVEGYFYDATFKNAADLPANSGAIVPGSWTPIQASGPVKSAPDAGPIATMVIEIFAVPEMVDSCFYVDDVRFYKQ